MTPAASAECHSADTADCQAALRLLASSREIGICSAIVENLVFLATSSQRVMRQSCGGKGFRPSRNLRSASLPTRIASFSGSPRTATG